MILANGPIGVLNSVTHWVLPENSHSNLSSSHGRLPVPQKPLFGRALSLRLAKKGWNFDARNTKCRLCCSLANEEVGSGSVASRFIEKELKFSPAFSDYVKALEAVRVDRSKDSDGDEDRYGSKQTSISKGKSSRIKRQLHGNKDDDCQERANVEENGLRRDMIDHRRRDKDLVGGAGLARNKSDGGWALIEGLLEKGSARRNGDVGKGKQEKNKCRSNSKALRKFDSKSNVNDVEENLDNGHLENRKVRYSGRPNYMQQKEQKAAWVDKLETFKGNDVKMERSNSRSLGRKFCHGRAMFAHGTHTKSNSRQSDDNNFSGDIAGDQIGHINDNHSYRNKEKKKIHDYETNNCRERVYSIRSSVQRKSGEPAFIKDALKANSSYENNTSKKSFGYGLDKNTNEDESHLKMDRGERQTSSRRSRKEFEFKDDFNGQITRVKKLVGKQTNYIDHSVKQNHFASFKISNEQDRNKWHVGMHNNNYGATKIHGKVNMGSNNITGDVDGYDFEDRAAFKTFEVFTDVRNRPRVLRMEMEERIEKLAKQYWVHWGTGKEYYKLLNGFSPMRDLSPTRAAYRCIAVTLGQAGLMKELFDVIDCMRAVPVKKFNLGPLQKWDPRIEPDLIVFNAVSALELRNRSFDSLEVPALWREGKIDEAVLAVKDMERRGIVGTASLYYDLARCLCSAGRCQEALLQIDKICKVAKKPLVVTYTGLIKACLDSGSIENGAFKWDDFENAYGQMLNHGYHFDTRRHMRTVLDAFRAGKVLESTWQHLVRFGRVPPPPFIKERFCIKLLEDDPVAAIACIDIHQEIDMLAFSERSWLKLLNGNAHRFKNGVMLRLAHELDAFIAQTSESLPVYENLRKACEQFVAHANTIPSFPDHLEESHNT
ncbi:hypothetical protein BHM03_00053636 [Ensete ventricosum]|nr:hypothetical protein BHM03_00053636 [Ensete ventricosum]